MSCLKYLGIISLLLLCGCGQQKSAEKAAAESTVSTAQNDKAVNNCTEVATLQEVDRQPVFPGGSEALAMYFYKNLRIPEPHRNLEKDGLISFLVDCNGYAKDFRSVNSINADIDRAIEIAILKMPEWQPAINNNEAVNYRVCLRVQVVRGSTALQPQSDCE